MRYRKQIQHIRRYRSGRWTAVNRGVRYKLDYGIMRRKIKLIKPAVYTGDHYEINFFPGATGTVIANEGSKHERMFYIAEMYTGHQVYIDKEKFIWDD